MRGGMVWRATRVGDRRVRVMVLNTEVGRECGEVRDSRVEILKI